MSLLPIPPLPNSFGEQLRHWRQHRRLSQLELACTAAVSSRHLSFMETGRASPSRGMILRLADYLNVPLRARNELLLSAGYSPHFAEHDLGDTVMSHARETVANLLKAHEPYPALAVDGHWNLVLANDALMPLLQDVDAKLLDGPVNVLRASLHPDGLAPNIVNLAQWRAHLLHRLHQQYEQSADPFLVELLNELSAYPYPDQDETPPPSITELAVPLVLRTRLGTLSLLSTTMVFGTPRDITLSELAIETFLPADASTRVLLEQLILCPAINP